MNYKKLKLALDSGDKVVFKCNDAFQIIGGAGTDMYGNYRRSGLCDTEEKCLEFIGSFNGYSEEKLKEYLPTWTYIRSIPPEHNLVPIGTEVLILDNAKEMCEKYDIGCDGEIEEIIGKVCEIQQCGSSSYWIWNEDKSDSLLFPRQAFTIYLGEEEDDKMAEAMELLKKNGYKIIK